MFIQIKSNIGIQCKTNVRILQKTCLWYFRQMQGRFCTILVPTTRPWGICWQTAQKKEIIYCIYCNFCYFLLHQFEFLSRTRLYYKFTLFAISSIEFTCTEHSLFYFCCIYLPYVEGRSVKIMPTWNWYVLQICLDHFRFRHVKALSHGKVTLQNSFNWQTLWNLKNSSQKILLKLNYSCCYGKWILQNALQVRNFSQGGCAFPTLQFVQKRIDVIGRTWNTRRRALGLRSSCMFLTTLVADLAQLCWVLTLYHNDGCAQNRIDQGGPRLRAWRATLRFEEKSAGHKDRNSIAIKRFVCCSNRPTFFCTPNAIFKFSVCLFATQNRYFLLEKRYTTH